MWGTLVYVLCYVWYCYVGCYERSAQDKRQQGRGAACLVPFCKWRRWGTQDCMFPSKMDCCEEACLKQGTRALLQTITSWVRHEIEFRLAAPMAVRSQATNIKSPRNL